MSVKLAGDEAARAFEVHTPIDEVVAYLRETITPKFTAYVGRVNETRATREWADGTREPQGDDRVRVLRLAARIAKLITDEFDVPTTQAWFQSMDPMVDDRAPLQVLRDHDDRDGHRALLASARRFVVQ